nr:hypothetical protein CFP56_12431 [Quercus suber]
MGMMMSKELSSVVSLAESIKSTEEVDEWRRRRQSPSALDIRTWGFILDSVYEHGGGSVGGNSFIAFARKKGVVEEGFE